MFLAPECEIAKELAEEIGMDRVTYIREAMQYYCTSKEGNQADKEFNSALKTIEKLGCKKYRTNSKEVQAEVKRVHEFFSNMNILTEEGTICMLRQCSYMYGSNIYIKSILIMVQKEVLHGLYQEQ